MIFVAFCQTWNIRLELTGADWSWLELTIQFSSWWKIIHACTIIMKSQTSFYQTTIIIWEATWSTRNCFYVSKIILFISQPFPCKSNIKVILVNEAKHNLFSNNMERVTYLKSYWLQQKKIVSFSRDLIWYKSVRLDVEMTSQILLCINHKFLTESHST